MIDKEELPADIIGESVLDSRIYFSNYSTLGFFFFMLVFFSKITQLIDWPRPRVKVESLKAALLFVHFLRHLHFFPTPPSFLPIALSRLIRTR